MNNLFRWIALILFIILIALISFVTGSLTSKNTSNFSLPLVNKTDDLNKPEQTDSLFLTQNAVTQGKVTAINGNTLTISSNNGTTGDVTLAKDFLVYPLKKAGNPTEPTSDIKLIELNKEATFNLVVADGKFLVATIHFLNPPVSETIPDKPNPSN